MSSIHCKLVDHCLSEHAMILICIPYRPPSATSPNLTKIPIGDTCSSTYQHRNRNDTYRHEDIQDMNVDIFQQPDKGSVHPRITVCSTLLYRYHLFSISIYRSCLWSSSFTLKLDVGLCPAPMILIAIFRPLRLCSLLSS